MNSSPKALNQLGVGMKGDGDVHGARLLLSDMRVAYLLLDEARYRATERLFGVSRENSSLVTIIALAMLANAVHEKAVRVLGVQAPPSIAGTLFAAGAVKESVHAIAGAGSRDTPAFTTLIAIAAVGTAVGPVLVGSFRRARAASHRARIGFDHRYGHLIRPNHPSR